MEGEVIYGTDIQVFLDGTLVACGQSISVKSTRKEIPVTCAGTGDIDRARTGKAKYTFQIQGLWRFTKGTDVAGNVTTYELWKKYIANEEVTIEIKPEIKAPATALEDEDVLYVGTGYFKDMGMDGQVDEAGKFDIGGFFNDWQVTKYEA